MRILIANDDGVYAPGSPRFMTRWRIMPSARW